MHLPTLLLAACAEPAPTWSVDSGAAGPRVELGPEVACANPGARAEAPFDRVELGSAPGLREAELIGAGAVVADLTGDGRSDVFFPGPTPSMWEGVAGGAPRELPGRLDDLDLADAVGASAADADGDGDLDLFVTRWLRPDVLLANDGSGRFVDVTARAGVGGGATRHSASAWGDLEGDGDLDLFVGTYGETPGDGYSYDDPSLPPSADRSELWENLGDGTFRDLGGELPDPVHRGYTFQASWLDVEGDGLPELFVWNDFGTAHPSGVLANRGGALTWTEGAGLDRPFEDMGVAIADLDGDGLPDFATTSFRKLGLLVSRPAETAVGAAWVDEADARGLSPAPGQAYGWGAAFGDLDADGAEELAVGFGYWSTYPNDLDPRWQNDALFVPGADGRFSDQGRAWGVYEPFVTRGLVLADLDDDGFLDLVKRFLDRPPVVHLSRCDERAWLRVSLRDAGRNPAGVGARVTATLPDGRRITRWIEAGSSSQFVGGPPEAHLGLGEAERVDLEVRWPDGATLDYPNLPTRRRVTLAR